MIVLPNTSADPIGDALKAGNLLLDLAPGRFPRVKGPLGLKNVHIRGFDRSFGGSTIVADKAVGSSDNFILGPGDEAWVLERLNIELDDRAGLKTVSGVGPKHLLVDVNMYGPGSPHDPAWKNDCKWGSHRYETDRMTQLRVWKWGVYGEHGDYDHNQQGDVNYVEGGAGYLGGCDIFHASRMNEGPEGKGNTLIRNRTTREVCIGQGGSAFTFRGGVPGGSITIDGSVGRLGCDAGLAKPFSDNICGMLSVDSADETEPGTGDAAWPGAYSTVYLNRLDWEVGTVFQGRTGMIRPVATVGNCELFTMMDSSIRVKRAEGAYPIALAIRDTCKEVAISGKCEVVGWIDYHGTRFQSLLSFLNAHPECAM